MGFFFKKLFIIYMSTLLLSSDAAEEGVRFQMVVIPCGCWDLNLGPSEEQLVLLTSEPSLQLLGLFFLSSLFQKMC